MSYKHKSRGPVQLTGRQTGKTHAYQQYMQALVRQLTCKETYRLIVERSEGRVFGARYWTVHPIVEPTVWSEMMAWMVETFGPTAEDGVFTPSQRWYANNAKFWFREEADLLVFLLKWQ